MAVTLKQTETAPENYPAIPSSPAILSDAAAALNPAMVWQRIESYIAQRWSEREVVWLVEGPGEWIPPLAPADVTMIEVWSRAGEWEQCDLQAAPQGYWLSATGPFRFTATVGADVDLPANAVEAFRRLAEYMTAKPGTPGASHENITTGSVSLSKARSSSWVAEAMQNSGAADLLRNYRRA
jgi:hypothetical protein